jgi:hypothetical protein
MLNNKSKLEYLWMSGGISRPNFDPPSGVIEYDVPNGTQRFEIPGSGRLPLPNVNLGAFFTAVRAAASTVSPRIGTYLTTPPGAPHADIHAVLRQMAATP